MRRFARFGLLFFLPLLTLAACAPHSTTTLTPKVTATMTPQPLPTNLDLNSISMVSPTEGWAVGHTTPPPNFNVLQVPPGKNYVDPVLLHYEQGRWSQATLPNLDPNWGAIQLNSISMVSATEGWAVGNSVLPPNADGFQIGIVLHFLNGQWAVTYEQRAFRISSVFMRSASDGWMLGTATGDVQQQALVLHYNGSEWATVHDGVFAHMIPGAIAGVSEDSIWVTGTDYSGSGFDGDAPEMIVHYDGHAWTREKTDLGNARLGDVLMLSPDEGWAVGGNPGRTLKHVSGPPYGLILHYHNGVWEDQAHIPAPPDNYFYVLSSVAMVSSSDGWVVGPGGTILHYQAGAWTQVPSPTTKDLRSVVMLSATEGWAVGVQSTLVHYMNGVWNLVNQ